MATKLASALFFARKHSLLGINLTDMAIPEAAYAASQTEFDEGVGAGQDQIQDQNDYNDEAGNSGYEGYALGASGPYRHAGGSGGSYGGNGSYGGGRSGGGDGHVVLDLTGKDINITQKSSSNTFFDMAGLNVGDYLTISLPRTTSFEGLPIAGAMRRRGATPWRGLMIVDLRNGDIVEGPRLEGNVNELFDVASIPQIRAPRAINEARAY